MKKIINWLSLRSTFTITIVVLSAKLFLNFLFLYVKPWYQLKVGYVGGSVDVARPIWEEVVTSCFLIPIFETLVFQSLVIYVLQSFTKLSIWSIILVSAILFASTHWYSSFYLVYAFLSGIVYAVTFISCQKKRNYRYAFLIVCTIHILYNTIGLIYIL